MRTQPWLLGVVALDKVFRVVAVGRVDRDSGDGVGSGRRRGAGAADGDGIDGNQCPGGIIGQNPRFTFVRNQARNFGFPIRARISNKYGFACREICAGVELGEEILIHVKAFRELFHNAGKAQMVELGELGVIFRQLGRETRNIFICNSVGDDDFAAHRLQRVPDQWIDLAVDINTIDLLEAADRLFNIVA